MCNTIKEQFYRGVDIQCSQNRGFFIISTGKDGGVHCLYADGIIRDSVSNDAFWDSKEEAYDFWYNWKNNPHKFPLLG